MKDLSKIYIGMMLLDREVYIKYPVFKEAIYPEYQEIFTLIGTRIINDEPIEITALYLALDKKFTTAFLAECMELAVTAKAAKYYANKINNLYRSQKVINWADETKELLKNNSEPEAIEQVLHNLTSIYQQEILTPYESLNRLYDDELFHVEQRIELGVDELDKALVLDRGGFHILAGRPGMGKTSCALWMLQQVLAQNLSAIMFSLEMPKYQLVKKLKTMGVDKNAPLLISDLPSQTIERIILISKMAKEHHDIQLVVIDYLQLIKTTERYQNREQQVSFISQTLKQLAKIINCPVLALCQLNRQAEGSSEGSRVPSLSHLRESGSLEQDADSVSLLYRPEYYYRLESKEVPEDQKGLCKFIIAKQRNAPTGSLLCDWNADNNSWSNWRTYEFRQTDSRFGQLSVGERKDWQ